MSYSNTSDSSMSSSGASSSSYSTGTSSSDSDTNSSSSSSEDSSSSDATSRSDTSYESDATDSSVSKHRHKKKRRKHRKDKKRRKHRRHGKKRKHRRHRHKDSSHTDSEEEISGDDYDEDDEDGEFGDEGEGEFDMNGPEGQQQAWNANMTPAQAGNNENEYDETRGAFVDAAGNPVFDYQNDIVNCQSFGIVYVKPDVQNYQRATLELARLLTKFSHAFIVKELSRIWASPNEIPVAIRQRAESDAQSCTQLKSHLVPQILLKLYRRLKNGRDDAMTQQQALERDAKVIADRDNTDIRQVAQTLTRQGTYMAIRPWIASFVRYQCGLSTAGTSNDVLGGGGGGNDILGGGGAAWSSNAASFNVGSLIMPALQYIAAFKLNPNEMSPMQIALEVTFGSYRWNYIAGSNQAGQNGFGVANAFEMQNQLFENHAAAYNGGDVALAAFDGGMDASTSHRLSVEMLCVVCATRLLANVFAALDQFETAGLFGNLQQAQVSSDAQNAIQSHMRHVAVLFDETNQAALEQMAIKSVEEVMVTCVIEPHLRLAPFDMLELQKHLPRGEISTQRFFGKQMLESADALRMEGMLNVLSQEFQEQQRMTRRALRKRYKRSLKKQRHMNRHNAEAVAKVLKKQNKRQSREQQQQNMIQAATAAAAAAQQAGMTPMQQQAAAAAAAAAANPYAMYPGGVPPLSPYQQHHPHPLLPNGQPQQHQGLWWDARRGIWRPANHRDDGRRRRRRSSRGRRRRRDDYDGLSSSYDDSSSEDDNDTTYAAAIGIPFPGNDHRRHRRRGSSSSRKRRGGGDQKKQMAIMLEQQRQLAAVQAEQQYHANRLKSDMKHAEEARVKREAEERQLRRAREYNRRMHHSNGSSHRHKSSRDRSSHRSKGGGGSSHMSNSSLLSLSSSSVSGSNNSSRHHRRHRHSSSRRDSGSSSSRHHHRSSSNRHGSNASSSHHRHHHRDKSRHGDSSNGGRRHAHFSPSTLKIHGNGASDAAYERARHRAVQSSPSGGGTTTHAATTPKTAPPVYMTATAKQL